MPGIPRIPPDFKAALPSTLVEWVAHCTKVIGSIPEGDQKGHKYTCFARSALFTGNLYDLYALIKIKSINNSKVDPQMH